MRTTISLDNEVAKLAGRIANSEKRSFSNLCEVALSTYCGPRDSNPAHAAVIAIADDLGTDRALEALRKEQRRLKAAHARAAA